MKQGYEKSRYLGSYDLSSAYPAGAVELPSLAPYAGEWVHKTNKKITAFNSLAELQRKGRSCIYGIHVSNPLFAVSSFSKLAKGEAARLNPKKRIYTIFSAMVSVSRVAEYRTRHLV